MKRISTRLTGRDRLILDHVHRHRLSTDDIVQRCLFPNVQGDQAVRKVMRRLVERRFLREYELKAGAPYYIVAPRGARALGIKPSEPRPFTEQSLPAALAIAYYCAAKNVRRFTAQEFVTKFRCFCRPGLRSSGYFIEETDQGLFLGFFVVDRGAKERRVLSKIRKVISTRYKIPEFAKLIQDGRFVLVVLTGYMAKRQELLGAIAENHGGPVQVRVEVVPELGFLLTRMKSNEASRRNRPRHA